MEVASPGSSIHDGGGLAGQLDVGLGGQAQGRGPLVQLVDAQPVAHLIEEVVAGVLQALHDGLVLVQGGVGGPALGGVGLVGLVEAAQVADALVQRDGALGESRQGGDQLEDGAGRVLGGDGAVVEGIVALHGVGPQALVHLAVVEDGQVVVGIGDHAQHPPGVGVHGHHGAGFGQVDVPVVFLVLLEHVLVLVLPVFAAHGLFLLLADGGDGGGQRRGHHLLQVHVDGQHHGVAVGGRGVGQLAHSLAAGVHLHHALALTVFDVGGQLVLQGALDAVGADVGVVGVALALVGLQRVLADLADVAGDVAGGAALRVDAGGALRHVHAQQVQRPDLDLGDGLVAHVVGDGDGGGVEGVHAALLPQCQHLHDQLLIALQVQLAQSRQLVDAVFFQQGGVEVLFLCPAQIEVGAPLAFAGGLHGGGVGPGIEAPGAVVVFLEPKIVDTGLAVGLHQPDDLDQRPGVGQAVLVAVAGGVAVEGDVVAAAVIGQRNHVGIENGSAVAVEGDGLGGAA